MGSPYEIDITMTQPTVDALRNGGFALYAFKAVKTQLAGGAPLVWFNTTAILTTTKVQWQEDYQAYISTNQIISGGTVTATQSCSVDLGQTANVTNTGGMTAAAGGDPQAISINNVGQTQWTTGISQLLTNGSTNPMCAIPLYGNMLDVIVPIEKVLLMFASNTVNTGTVIYKAYSSGVMSDLTAQNTRALTFDINGGWTWDGGAWAKPVAANSDLVPLLITS